MSIYCVPQANMPKSDSMGKIDVVFKLIGKSIHADYAYPLYAGISRIFDAVHHDNSIGIHPIVGKRDGNRLTINKFSFLTLRVPNDYLAEAVNLSGKEIFIQEDVIRIAFHSLKRFLPRPNLTSRLVIVKGFMEPESFLAAVKRQLDEMKVLGKPFLVASRSGLARRIMIKDKKIVGFPVVVMGLSPEESLKLQDQGIGGRRHFGCGVFVDSERQIWNDN